MNNYQPSSTCGSNSNLANAPVRSNRGWVPVIAGLAIGLVAMHVFVTRPLLKQINSLQQQVQTVTRDIELVAGLRDQWTAAADVITAAAESRREVNEAWKSIEAIRQLREGVEIEAGRFNELAATLAQIRSMHDEVATLQGSLSQQAASILAIKRTVAQFDQARTDLNDEIKMLRSARAQLAEFNNFSDEIARQKWGIEQARQSLESLLLIKNDVIRSSHDIEFARRRTDTMLDIVSRLRSEGAQVGTALDNLARLEQMRDRLNSSSQQVIGAIQSLDILEGFQKGITLDYDRLAYLRSSIEKITNIACSSEDILKLFMPIARQQEFSRENDAEIRAATRAILDIQRDDNTIPSTLEPVSDKRIE